MALQFSLSFAHKETLFVLKVADSWLKPFKEKKQLRSAGLKLQRVWGVPHCFGADTERHETLYKERKNQYPKHILLTAINAKIQDLHKQKGEQLRMRSVIRAPSLWTPRITPEEVSEAEELLKHQRRHFIHTDT